MTTSEINTFSFAAAGWMQMYHFGVGKALQDCQVGGASGGHPLDPLSPPVTVKFAGTSAGALASLALACGVDFDELADYAVSCSNHCRDRPLPRAFMLRGYVNEGVVRFANAVLKTPAPSAASTPANASAAAARPPSTFGEGTDDERASSDDGEVQLAVPPEMTAMLQHRLEVYATVLPWLKAKRFTVFESLPQLQEALLASCCIAPLAGLPFRLRYHNGAKPGKNGQHPPASGPWVVDGGLTAFQPRKGERGVVTVSPIYFDSADIKPSCFIPVWWGLFPPNESQYRALYDLGYKDAVDYFVRKRLVEPSKLGDVQLRQKQRMDNGTDGFVRRLPKRSLANVAWDVAAFFTFLFVLRPFSLLLVYTEMALVTVATLLLALLYDVTPAGFSERFLPVVSYLAGSRSAKRRHGTRLAAWMDVYYAARNLVSLRVPMHVLLGSKVPVNAQRLERYSRIYRVVRPILG